RRSQSSIRILPFPAPEPDYYRKSTNVSEFIGFKSGCTFSANIRPNQNNHWPEVYLSGRALQAQWA
ncbi:MAG: hypothetical protein J2P13_06370, partial [Acidobacteria bacterium]|nr:hypothetical protein [Acidobacteriota bacterium]